MPEQALYLKWRPLSFDDVVGQEHITRTLRNSLKTGRIRHAYLFSGPRGTGKTTTARLLAKAVNCQNPDPDKRPCNECPSCIAVNEGRYLDLIEIDAATHTGVDDVRDLRDKVAFTPGEGRYKVYIIDEVHRFTGNAFDALLKTLEEPPDHAIFVLATTEIDKVPATIKSRCLQFEFRRVSLIQVADRLQTIAESEGLKIERGALELVARQGTGSVRDSISLLDQMVSDPNEVITLDVAQRILGTASSTAVKELVEAIVNEDIPRGLHEINLAIDSGNDPRQFGQQTVEHLRAVLLAQTSSADLVEASAEDHALFDRQARKIARPVLLRAIRAFNDAVNEYRGGWQPQLSLELALIDSIRGPEEHVVQQVVQVAAAQPAAQSAQQSPARPTPTAPGSPPVIPPSVVQAKWSDMLRALYRLNRTAPEVVEKYRVFKVDGNVVYICTDDEFLFRRLEGQQAKLEIIETALFNIHNVPLNVQVVLVDDTGQQRDNDDIDDPVIRTVLELGGEIQTDGD
ncbi:MAG: hypothetical protein OHK0046_14080 [Anaerolineae bacterium]